MSEEEQEIRYLSPRQFAEATGLAVNSVYSMITRGRLLGVLSSRPDGKGRGVHLIPASEVEAYPKRRQTRKLHGHGRALGQETERGRRQRELTAA